MPSSTFSSKPAAPGLRQTASDRPGVAQPVPERDIPPLAWGKAFIVALLLFAALLGGWEWHWRAYGVEPATRNSDGLWAMQRRRIDAGEGGSTVLIGSSRIFYDINLDVWQRLSGQRPIQLALQGTSPIFELEDLASDPNFTGRLIVGVTPSLFFANIALRGNVLKYYRHESPADRVGQWLSMNTVERVFAFYDPDYALTTVLRRQDWPLRSGVPRKPDLRRLAITGPDRNSHLWNKVVTDPEYQALVRHIWAVRNFTPLDADKQAKLKLTIQKETDRAVAAVAKLRARGIDVIFLRAPCSGEYLAYEDRYFPRDQTWDVLLARTGAPGIHFQDYADMRDYQPPEWSHLSQADAETFTASLYELISTQYWK